VQVRLGWQLTEIDFQSNEDEPFDFLIAPCQQVTREHKSEKLTTRYLMACDGASSPTRKLLDIQQEDLQCDEPWLVCDLKLGEGVSYDRTALQICDPKQPASLIPCESDHIRWEFMLNKNFDVDKIEEESCVRGLMANHLHRLGPHIKSTDGELIRAKVYNFHALIAERFQAGNIFLLGDAAHQMPPFLGQGMCAGIRDAHNLCWKLSGVLAGKFAPRILDTYSTERLPQVRRIIETAIAHGAIIQTRNPVKAFIRDSYLMLGRLFPILVGFLKFGESWQLGDGLFISDTKTGLRRPVAEPLPQSLISSNSFDASEPSFLSDELLSDKFTVIGFGIDPRTLTLDWEKLAWLDVLCIGLKGHFQEVQGELMRWATENQIAVAVVRPDRQIYGFCGKDAQLDAKLSVVINRLAKSLE
jgi:3-(3-hydroxy-phenyl)propionate hydroxylase